MNVLEQTADRLVLEIVPHRSRMFGAALAVFGLLLFVYGFFGSGGCLMYFIGGPMLMASLGTLIQEPVQTLTFSRPDNRLRVEVKSLAGRYRWKANIDYIARALVQTGTIAKEATNEEEAPGEADEEGGPPTSLFGRMTASRHVMIEFKDSVRRAAVRHVESNAIAEEITSVINQWLPATPAG